MKKKLVSLLLAAVMVLSFTACGDESSGGTQSSQEDGSGTQTGTGNGTSGKQGKVYYLNFKPEVDATWQEIAKTYTAETGVDVKVVTAASGTYEKVLKTEIVQSEPVTLFQINGPIGYQSWTDYCLDLSDTDIYNSLSDQTLAIKGDDEGVYGIPYTIEGYGIIYNDAIMQKYFAMEGAKASNIEEINNFTILRDVVEDMTAKKEELGIEGVFASTSLLPGEDWRWQTHLVNIPVYYEYQNEGITDTDAIQLSFGDNMKNIFDLYVNNSITSKGLLGSKAVTDSMAEFALGQVAMVQNGNWAWSQINEVEGNVVEEENVKFMPIYTGMDGEENQGLCIGTENFWAVNSQASKEDQEASLNFIRWLINSEEGKAFMVNDLGNISPFTTFEEDEKPTDPLAKSMLESMESGKTAVPWSFTTFPGQTFKDDFGAALLEYCNGNMTWDEVEETFVTRWAEEKEAMAAGGQEQ